MNGQVFNIASFIQQLICHGKNSLPLGFGLLELSKLIGSFVKLKTHDLVCK